MSDYRSAAYDSYSRWKDYARQVDVLRLRGRLTSLANSWLLSPEITFIQKNFPKTAKVLELGCGSGTFLYQLQQNNFQNLVGVDIAYSPELRSGIQFRRDDVFDFLNKEKEKRDLILMLDVLEHFKKDEAIRLLKLCGERLTPRGRLICRLPNASSAYGLPFMFGDLTHELFLTESSIHQLAGICGFNKVQFLRSHNRLRAILSRSRSPLNLLAVICYLLTLPGACLLRRGAFVFHGLNPPLLDPNIVFVLTADSDQHAS